MGQWPTFHGPVILLYLEDYLMDEWWSEDIDLVRQENRPEAILNN